MMENLINDLLDMAKLENNQFKISQEYFNLTSLIENSFQIMLQSANQQGIRMNAVIEDEKHLDLV